MISNLTLASGKCFRFRFVRFSRQVDRAETGTRTIETKKGGGDRREETLSQVKRSGSWSGVIKRLLFGRLAISTKSQVFAQTALDVLGSVPKCFVVARRGRSPVT